MKCFVDIFSKSRQNGVKLSTTCSSSYQGLVLANVVTSEGQQWGRGSAQPRDEHWSVLLGWKHESPGTGLKTRHEELTLNFNELEMITKASSWKL